MRTFKYRGRVTPGQRRALDELWSLHGLDLGTEPVDLAVVFGRRAPVVLDIGFGMGETTLAMAAAEPDRDVLAVDVHTPGAGALLRGIDEQGLINIRVSLGDGRDVLRDMLAPASLAEVRVYFPDPWPKTKHHKRRLLSASFAHLVATRLVPGGVLHVATDWTPYAERVLEVVAAEPMLTNLHEDDGGYAPRPPWRPVTRFERQGTAKGHPVHDVLARRTG